MNRTRAPPRAPAPLAFPFPPREGQRGGSPKRQVMYKECNFARTVCNFARTPTAPFPPDQAQRKLSDNAVNSETEHFLQLL